MTRSDISVVIPAYNAGPFLAEALTSVLEQTLPPLEVIVVDDGSDDDTAEVARRFGPRVVLETQPNRGNGAARNRGVRMSRGAFLAFLDADDVWCRPDKLELQRAVLEHDSSLDAVFGHMAQFHTGSGALSEPQPAPVGVTMLVRRAFFERVGPFREDLRLGVFIDWYARAQGLGMRSSMLAEVVTRRRVHGRNTSIQLRSERQVYARILKAAIDRRKKGGE